jgi:hypothetical protein
MFRAALPLVALPIKYMSDFPLSVCARVSEKAETNGKKSAGYTQVLLREHWPRSASCVGMSLVGFKREQASRAQLLQATSDVSNGIA